MSKPSLYLQEEIMLLALRDEEGTVPLGASGYPYAIGAAILAELLLANQIRVVGAKSRAVVEAQGEGADLESPLLEECFEKIRKAPPANLERWVIRFASLPKLKHRVAKGLCERGILRAEDESVFLAFKRRIYPEIDHAPEKALIGKLERAIFDDDSKPVRRTAALIAIADSVELLAIPFSAQSLKKRKKRIHQIASGEIYADASREAYEPIRSIVDAVSSNVVVFRN